MIGIAATAGPGMTMGNWSHEHSRRLVLHFFSSTQPMFCCFCCCCFRLGTLINRKCVPSISMLMALLWQTKRLKKRKQSHQYFGNAEAQIYSHLSVICWVCVINVMGSTFRCQLRTPISTRRRNRESGISDFTINFTSSIFADSSYSNSKRRDRKSLRRQRWLVDCPMVSISTRLKISLILNIGSNIQLWWRPGIEWERGITCRRWRGRVIGQRRVHTVQPEKVSVAEVTPANVAPPSSATPNSVAPISRTPSQLQRVQYQ